MPATAPLSADARALCPHCRQRVWVYNSPNGEKVLLDDAPGEYLIDGLNKAWRSTRFEGYRNHQESCPRRVREPLVHVACEFPWV